MQTDTVKFVYFINENNTSANSAQEMSDETLNQVLKSIATQALKEKTPSMKDLETILDDVLQNSLSQNESNDGQQETKPCGNDEPVTKYLQKLGYLR